MTFAALDQRSRAVAQSLRSAQVPEGATVAILMDNRPDFVVAAWAAQRSGLYYTPVNWHVTGAESE